MEKYSLNGVNRNAFSVIAYVAKAMEREGFSQDKIISFKKEAMSSDYDDLLYTAMDMVDELNGL